VISIEDQKIFRALIREELAVLLNSISAAPPATYETVTDFQRNKAAALKLREERLLKRAAR